MSDPARSHQETPESAETVSVRVREIIEEAQRAAVEIRTSAEQAAREQARELAEAAERHARHVRGSADEEIDRVRREALLGAQRYDETCRRMVQDFAEERLRRLEELSATLTDHAAEVDERFTAAAAVRRQLEQLVDALGNAAEQIVEEAAKPFPELPSLSTVRQASGPVVPREPAPAVAAGADRGDGGPSDDPVPDPDQEEQHAARPDPDA